MPEIVCMLSNIKNHMEYLASTIKHLSNCIRDNPTMLTVGATSAKIKELLEVTQRIIDAADEFHESALKLDKHFQVILLLFNMYF